MLKERTLEHRQNYQYKIHLPKLRLTAKAIPPDVATKTTNYLFSILDGFPDELFCDERIENLDQQVMPEVKASKPPAVIRSSTSDFETLPISRTPKQNLANDLAAMGLLLARKNKDRHPSIQDFMLANDSCTIACEVPVYLTAEEVAYYQSKGFFLPLPELSKPITGHIDIVQLRNGFIHLLDYKPKAREIDAVNQLVIYALAFASRARLPVKAFKCAWFDERDFFEFFPLQAVRAKPLHATV
jgi:ATP-dependent exoDNAse (exonuclease V) beta subunit